METTGEKKRRELTKNTSDAINLIEKNQKSAIEKNLQTPHTQTESELLEAWQRVEKSRHPLRPYTADYIANLFSEFEEFKGDRAFGEDPALIAGMGILKGTEKFPKPLSIVLLGHQKGRNTKQKIERNFGMARPEGYRKAMRVMEIAERFSKPLLTFIDTPGAFPGIGAEERGQSEAIASSIRKIFETKVPSVGIVIGEGGSGGALAIGVTDRLLMLENATYSVISPESCAAILWGTAAESKRAASALRLSAKDAQKFGVCDAIIGEPAEISAQTTEELSNSLLDAVRIHFDELMKMKPEERLSLRYKKYRNIGC